MVMSRAGQTGQFIPILVSPSVVVLRGITLLTGPLDQESGNPLRLPV
jgi:hypothetical protein